MHWVDYKGVREIMKSSIEKVTSYFKLRSGDPEAEAAFEDQLEAVHQVLKVIFDRNTALLPRYYSYLRVFFRSDTICNTSLLFCVCSYFIVNELLKSYPENTLWPHWRLVPLISNLVNSFRAPAQIVSGNR